MAAKKDTKSVKVTSKVQPGGVRMQSARAMGEKVDVGGGGKATKPAFAKGGRVKKGSW